MTIKAEVKTMALKNLFDMVKADRYTADGREAIIKAQEAETEDKVYQIGEISQKTGLQKTANGWVKPKNGKQPGAKKQNAPTGSKKIDYQVTEKGGKFYATGHQFSDGSQLHAGPFGSEKELHEFMNGSPYKSTAESKPAAASKHDTDPQTYIVKKNDELRKMYLNEKDPAKKEAMKKALKKQASMMEPEPFSSTESKTAEKPAAEGWEETQMASGKIYDLKSQGKRIIEQYDPETKTFKLRDLNNSHTPDKEFKSLEEAKTAAENKTEESPTRPPLPEDSAPRVLTGDCRIRIRKEKPALTGDTRIRVRK